MEQYWNEFGALPGAERLIEKKIVRDFDEYEGLYNSDYIQNALNALGIKTDPDLAILTPKQLAAIQIMFDFHDTRSDTKKLRDLGINGQTWDNWLKDPEVQRYLKAKTGNIFDEQEHEIDRALFLKARSGNVEAIKLIHSIQGKYQTVEAPKIGQVEAHVFIMKLFEVLQQYLIDQPDKLKAIGEAIVNINSPYMNHPMVIEAVPVDRSD